MPPNDICKQINWKTVNVVEAKLQLEVLRNAIKLFWDQVGTSYDDSWTDDQIKTFDIFEKYLAQAEKQLRQTFNKL